MTAPELRRGATVVGGALRDAADPTHNVQPHRCLVCRGTDQLTLLSLSVRDLAGTGLHGAMPATCCVPHLEAALRRIGKPTPPGYANQCSGQHDGTDQTRFGVVAVWPRNTLHRPGAATIRACKHHLVTALIAVAADSKETDR